MSTTDSKRDLGERIRRARIEAGLTQETLGEKLGIHQGTVSMVESGNATLAAVDIPTWATALDKPIMYFFDAEKLPPVERAAVLLEMFSEDKLELILDMLHNMASDLSDSQSKA